MIHPLSDVRTKHIGENTNVWQYTIILEEAIIGDFCNINCHTFIENDVVIGDRVTIKSGVFLWDGIKVGDDVFIGPNATFTNDPFPKSRLKPIKFQKTFLKKGCSIGANATILGGVEIGEYAMIGAGSVVTKNIRPHALVVGNPAKQIGWVNDLGERLINKSELTWIDSKGKKYLEKNDALLKI